MRPVVSGVPAAPTGRPGMILGFGGQTGAVTGLRRVTRGHHLAAAAGVGETVLQLTETADFIEGEGRSQVMVSGVVYDYDEVDPDANTLTLATALTVAAAEDDPVDLFDPEVGGTVVVGYKAEIMLDDSDPTDRPITVDVSHSLVEMLEESERGDFGENVTVIRTGPYAWSLWQVDGKIAANLLADDAVAQADAAFDQALDALTQAELALAISDGMVDIYYETAAPWADGSDVHDDDTGDIWVDTDAASDTAYRWLNRTWTLIGDASIVSALLQAQSAQTTADGKIRLFVTTWAARPTIVSHPDLGYGDLLKATDQDNKEYYWDGDSWEPLVLGDDGIAAELIGKIVTGGTVRTSSGGYRLQMRDDGASGIIEAFDAGSLVASINPVPDGLQILCSVLEIGAVVQVPSPYWIEGNLLGNTSGTHTGAVNGNTSGTHTGPVNGGAIAGTTGTFSGDLHADNLYADAVPTTTDPANCRMSNFGRLLQSSSSRRYKANIKTAKIDSVAVLAAKARTWTSKIKSDNKAPGIGLIAEELDEGGLGAFVEYRDDRPESVNYDRFAAVGLLAVCQAQQQQIEALTARVEALEALPNNRKAR